MALNIIYLSEIKQQYFDNVFANPEPYKYPKP